MKILLCAVAGLTWLLPAAWAETGVARGTALPLHATAELDFELSIGKFVYLRIGVPGAAASAVRFELSPQALSAGGALQHGPARAVDWNGEAPVFGVSSQGHVLPVEVRSNAGQVELWATVSAPLVSATGEIPLSDLKLSSDDPALPAPEVPTAGTGPVVMVAGGGAGAVNNLVTLRSANWTFELDPVDPADYAAGVYSGQVTFTASVP